MHQHRRSMQRLLAVLSLSGLAMGMCSDVTLASGGECDGAQPAGTAHPTSFDFLVLASMADSQQPFAMAAGYGSIVAHTGE